MRSAIISGMSRSPLRQRQRGVELVVDDPHPGQPVPAVRRGAIEAVVVVPLEGGAFGAAVLAQVVDVGFASAPAEQQVVAGLARREVAGDLAVEGVRLGLGQAAGLAVELGPVVAAVEVDGELADAGRQLVVEGDLGAVAGGAADGRAGEGAAVGPEPVSRPGRICGLGRADRDPDVGVGQLARDRQRPRERDRRLRPATCRSPNGSRPPSRALSGSRTASAPPPRAPRKARRPRRGESVDSVPCARWSARPTTLTDPCIQGGRRT